MNDYEVGKLYEQVQDLEEQVQYLIESLLADCCKPKKGKAKKEKEE